MPTSTEDILNEFKRGWLEYGRMHSPLLEQLASEYTIQKSQGGESRSSDKPATRPPMNIGAMQFYWDCSAEVTLVENGKSDQTLRSFRLTARHILGYDAPRMHLAETSCHVCHSTLEVAEDASTNVVCTNPECHVEYAMDSWVDLLNAKDKAHE